MRESLWSTGTWFATILTAALILPFITKSIKVAGGGFPLHVELGVPVFLIAVFGLTFCLYATLVLKDIKEHIETNRRKSNYLRTKQVDASIDFRKTGWIVISGIIFMEGMAFFVMIILVFIP